MWPSAVLLRHQESLHQRPDCQSSTEHLSLSCRITDRDVDYTHLYTCIQPHKHALNNACTLHNHTHITQTHKKYTCKYKRAYRIMQHKIHTLSLRVSKKPVNLIPEIRCPESKTEGELPEAGIGMLFFLFVVTRHAQVSSK